MYISLSILFYILKCLFNFMFGLFVQNGFFNKNFDDIEHKFLLFYSAFSAFCSLFLPMIALFFSFLSSFDVFSWRCLLGFWLGFCLWHGGFKASTTAATSYYAFSSWTPAAFLASSRSSLWSSASSAAF